VAIQLSDRLFGTRQVRGEGCRKGRLPRRDRPGDMGAVAEAGAVGAPARSAGGAGPELLDAGVGEVLITGVRSVGRDPSGRGRLTRYGT
jgi:hypothetical protein